MAEDLLSSEHLREQVEVVRRSHGEPGFTLALLELSSWIDGHRRSENAALSAPDQAITADVLHVLDACSDVLARRMEKRACLYSDYPSIVPGRFVAPVPGNSAHSWKPGGALWTSPLIQEGNSAWSLRAAVEGDVKLRAYNLLLSRPEPSKAFLFEALARADSFLTSHGGQLGRALESLQTEGYCVLDFSWRCVLEAEISALRHERDPVAFPCGLGVECSLWLEAPSHAIGVVDLVHPV